MAANDEYRPNHLFLIYRPRMHVQWPLRVRVRMVLGGYLEVNVEPTIFAWSQPEMDHEIGRYIAILIVMAIGVPQFDYTPHYEIHPSRVAEHWARVAPRPHAGHFSEAIWDGYYSVGGRFCIFWLIVHAPRNIQPITPRSYLNALDRLGLRYLPID